MKKLNKMLSLSIACALALSITACSSTESTTPATTDTADSSAATTDSATTTDDATTADTTATDDAGFVTVQAKNGADTLIEMQVPKNPQKVAFMDYVALDMCDALGILDDIEFISVQDALPSYLVDSVPEGTLNLGGLKGYQDDATVLPSIMEFGPEVIFTSGRSAADYDKFVEVGAENVGVVSTHIEYLPSTYESFKELNIRNASIFGMEAEMAEIISGYDARLEALKEWGTGKTAMMTIFNGGSMNVLGNDSRCSMIFNDLGFENVGTEVDTSHGDTASYENLLALNPDYIFVLDRDSAIGTAGATAALELLDNEIVQQSDAWKNGKVVVLDPIIWYMVEGGVSAMDVMLSDLETGMALEG